MAARERPVRRERLVRTPRSVVAYHGRSRTTADRIASGGAFELSRNDWDWLLLWGSSESVGLFTEQRRHIAERRRTDSQVRLFLLVIEGELAVSLSA